MESPLRVFFPVAAAVAIGGACSSASAPPPQLGDCHKIGDASCTSGNVGAGGGGGPGGDSGLDAEEGGVSCAAAEVALNATSPSCVPCVESSCCGSGAACEALPGVNGCLNLVQCMVGCGGNATCEQQCSIVASGAAVTAYGDYSSCLSGLCPSCPTLPPVNTSDL